MPAHASQPLYHSQPRRLRQRPMNSVRPYRRPMMTVRPTDERRTLIPSRGDAKGTHRRAKPMIRVPIPNVSFPKKTEGWIPARKADVPLSSVHLHKGFRFRGLCANWLAQPSACANDCSTESGWSANGVF